MNANKRHLSELDIKYISSKLGRIPTEIEISFIEYILSYELENRDYLRILSRLNDGAKREMNNTNRLDEKFNLSVQNGIKILDQNNSLIINKDETKYINKINRLDTVLDDIVINSSTNQNVEKILNKETNNRKDRNVIGGRFFKEEKNDIIFSTTIGFDKNIKINKNTRLKNSLVYKINFGKNTVKKNISHLTKFIDDIITENWFMFAKSINWNGLGVALVELIKDFNHGVKIDKEIAADKLNSHFYNDNTLSILTIVKQYNVPQLAAFCSKNNLEIDVVGTLIDDQIIHINSKNETLINLPISVFDLQYNVNTKHFIQPEIDIKSPEIVSKKYNKTSYSNQLIKLITNIIEDNILWKSDVRKKIIKDNYSSYGLYSDNKLIEDQIVLVQADKNHLIDISPRMSGRVSVASAVRRLSCTGAKPKIIIVQNIFPKMHNRFLWKASELLQGQEEAIRILEVEIGNRSIDTYNNYWHQNISAIGIHQQKTTKMDISFKNSGDFISLLGSHRGELTGSAYEQYITNEKSDVLPTVDLQMEKRLQDVVRQGINTNLIKSAVNVSAGGISVAIAKSLIASGNGLGARIHLSRKLKEEELLFGETQGLILVSLSEIDIMEFERICMTIGVPSTTIGRVTDNDLFTFNDDIKIKVEKLREVLLSSRFMH